LNAASFRAAFLLKTVIIARKIGLKLFITLLFLLSATHSYSQNSIPVFGELTPEDISITAFPDEPDAPGIVLYERAEYTVTTNQHFVILKEKIHRKIKVLDSKRFPFGSVSIPFYSRRDAPEAVKNLRAVTHNGTVQKSVLSNAIFEEKKSKNWRNLKFAFPDIQDGSILEYTYELHTPYFSRLSGWNFMNHLPTIYSELHTEIPGNYIYTRTLYGNRSLDVNKAEIKRGCFHLPGFKVAGDCEIATYAIRNIPSFKEEDYMLSYENYIPALAFELAQTVDLTGSKNYYANSWKNVDARLKKDKNFGSQLNMDKFFKGKLSADILSISNSLERAKAVFYEVQKSINWDGEVPFIQDVDVKKAFESGVGNATEINLGLASAMAAANLEAKIMLIAHREKRTPSKEHPVFYGFNYPLIHLTLDNQVYLLDATEKDLTFGVLPFRALNQYGRIIDFKKGSYWEDIQPYDKNMHYANVQMRLNADGKLTGTAQETYTGLPGSIRRKEYNEIDPNLFLSKKQQKTEHLNIHNFTVENGEDPEKPYVEKYDFEYTQTLRGDKIYVYPFLTETTFTRNLFRQTNRQYPIDFGYPLVNNYLISIALDEAYTIAHLPENQRIQLPNNDGDFSVIYDNSQKNIINIRFSLRLNNYHFPHEAYQSLKEFFEKIVKTQFETPVEVVKN